MDLYIYCSASRSFVSLNAHTYKIYNPSAEFQTITVTPAFCSKGRKPPIIKPSISKMYIVVVYLYIIFCFLIFYFKCIDYPYVK